MKNRKFVKKKIRQFCIKPLSYTSASNTEVKQKSPRVLITGSDIRHLDMEMKERN